MFTNFNTSNFGKGVLLVPNRKIIENRRGRAIALFTLLRKRAKTIPMSNFGLNFLIFMITAKTRKQPGVVLIFHRPFRRRHYCAKVNARMNSNTLNMTLNGIARRL